MSRTQRLLIGYARCLLRMFFRRIEVIGVENIPHTSGGLLISWHPNGAIDGAVLLANFPRRVVFGVRHGLLRIPVFGWMLRQIGSVPIYRHQDMRGAASHDLRRASNLQSVETLARAIADGKFAALFPEGRSHDEPHVQELKTGAAHLYYRSVELTPEGHPLPVIVPVGLHYNKKSIWGSQVLVSFHPPLSLADDLARPSDNEEQRYKQARCLTAEFERMLDSVTLATESWELHNLFQRIRKLVRAEGLARKGSRSQPSDIVERIRHFGRVWKNYQTGAEAHPKETAELFSSVVSYDRCLRALKVEDHELDGAWRVSPRKALLLLVEFLVIYLVLPLFLIIGILVNLPTMLLLQGLTKAKAGKYKDEASIKLVVGALLFPLTWLLAAWLVAWGGGILAAAYPSVSYSPILTGLLAFLLSAFGGLLALQFRQVATELFRTL